MRINLPNGSYIEESKDGGWSLFFDDGVMIRQMNSIEMNLILSAYYQGKKDNEVVISRDPKGYIVAVTRQDEDGRILQIVAEGKGVSSQLPKASSAEATAALNQMSKFYNYPCNPANCARYGWEAARNFLMDIPYVPKS